MESRIAHHIPVTLLDLFANAILLRQTAPYLTIRALLALLGSCKTIRELILASPEAWRYLDLTEVRSAIIDSSPIDVGGISWRAERMDEGLTEEDFFAGPLRGIMSRLHRQSVLRNVHTLVLDGLSVPADLVREIVAEDRYNVKVLSIRQAKNLNQAKLQQVLRYIVRPTRTHPQATPKLKALYVFGPRNAAKTAVSHQDRNTLSNAGGVTSSEGAQIGAELDSGSSSALERSLRDEEMRWYYPCGRVLHRPPPSGWAETLQACKGLVAFDAVICRGPRHDITLVDSKEYLQPAIATVALGEHGCEICHDCPEGPAVFGESPESFFPLLAPPPLHTTAVRIAQTPSQYDGRTPRLILRCEECLRGRWCERCQRWWSEDCYNAPTSWTHLQPETLRNEARQSIEGENAGSTIKDAAGAHLDCWICGRTCAACKKVHVRRCQLCQGSYCLEHDHGCSATECAWCTAGGRRTRDMY